MILNTCKEKKSYIVLKWNQHWQNQQVVQTLLFGLYTVKILHGFQAVPSPCYLSIQDEEISKLRVKQTKYFNSMSISCIHTEIFSQSESRTVAHNLGGGGSVEKVVRDERLKCLEDVAYLTITTDAVALQMSALQSMLNKDSTPASFTNTTVPRTSSFKHSTTLNVARRNVRVDLLAAVHISNLHKLN